MTKRKVAEFAARKSIVRVDGGPATQLVTVEYEAEVREERFKKADMTPAELEQIKLEVRDDATEEFREHIDALKAKVDHYEDRVKNLQEMEEELSQEIKEAPKTPPTPAGLQILEEQAKRAKEKEEDVPTN
jgi:Mg2+ and Co2+ transporter CorA